jgi:hypothetical protein
LLAQNIERKAVSRAIEELVVADDAFGLKSSISPFQLLQQVPTSAWRFKSNAQKVWFLNKFYINETTAKRLELETERIELCG